MPIKPAIENGGTDEPDVQAVGQALERLEAHPRHRRKAEIVRLRFFAGRTVPEVAEILGVSEPTVKREWRFARAWLRRALELGEEP